eukprot:gene10311-biopygen22803
MQCPSTALPNERLNMTPFESVAPPSDKFTEWAPGSLGPGAWGGHAGLPKHTSPDTESQKDRQLRFRHIELGHPTLEDPWGRQPRHVPRSGSARTRAPNVQMTRWGGVQLSNGWKPCVRSLRPSAIWHKYPCTNKSTKAHPREGGDLVGRASWPQRVAQKSSLGFDCGSSMAPWHRAGVQ